MRVGIRIEATEGVPENVTRPAILNGKNQFTRLLVINYHRKFHHGNNELVLNEIRQEFWITRPGQTIKEVAKKCLLCRIRCATPTIPRMGNLPPARLSHHFPNVVLIILVLWR